MRLLFLLTWLRLQILLQKRVVGSLLRRANMYSFYSSDAFLFTQNEFWATQAGTQCFLLNTHQLGSINSDKVRRKLLIFTLFANVLFHLTKTFRNNSVACLPRLLIQTRSIWSWFYGDFRTLIYLAGMHIYCETSMGNSYWFCIVDEVLAIDDSSAVCLKF